VTRAIIVLFIRSAGFALINELQNLVITPGIEKARNYIGAREKAENLRNYKKHFVSANRAHIISGHCDAVVQN
jgi:hypothetical protein